MKFASLAILFLYIYLEISVFVIVANNIGVLLTLIALVSTSILGISIVKSQGIRNVVQMQRKIQLGENPSQEIRKNVLLFLGGFLLLIPGFITAILGALLLLPVVQNLVNTYLFPRLITKSRCRYSIKSSDAPRQDNKSDEEIIEGTFTRKDDE